MNNFSHLLVFHKCALCNIYQVCPRQGKVRKAASPDSTQRLDQERSLWKAFSKHQVGKLSARKWVFSFLCMTRSHEAPAMPWRLARMHSNHWHARKSLLEKYWTDLIEKHLFRKVFQIAGKLEWAFLGQFQHIATCLSRFPFEKWNHEWNIRMFPEMLRKQTLLYNAYVIMYGYIRDGF